MLSLKLVRAILLVYRSEAVSLLWDESRVCGPVLRFCSTFLHLLPSMIRLSLRARDMEDDAAAAREEGENTIDRVETLEMLIQEALVAVDAVHAHAMDFGTIRELTPASSALRGTTNGKPKTSPRRKSPATAVQISKKDQSLLARVMVQIESAKDFLFDIRTTYHLNLNESTFEDDTVEVAPGKMTTHLTPTKSHPKTQQENPSALPLFEEIRAVLMTCNALQRDQENTIHTSKKSTLEQNGLTRGRCVKNVLVRFVARCATKFPFVYMIVVQTGR
jgi:hypothetical protein